MNRKAFFRSLILGGIIVPRVPKLILTGGWLDTGWVGHFAGPPIISMPGFGISRSMLLEGEIIELNPLPLKEDYDDPPMTVSELHDWVKRQLEEAGP